MPDRDFQLQNSAQAIEYGRECVRSGILVNGGAAVALVALLSGSAAFDRDMFLRGLLCFSIGTGLAVLACAGGYFAQTVFAMANARDSEKIYTRAVAVSVVTAAIMIASIGAFALGVYFSAQAVLNPPPPRTSLLSDVLPPPVLDLLEYLRP